jgi:hypothetical protein
MFTGAPAVRILRRRKKYSTWVIELVLGTEKIMWFIALRTDR